jgi:DNA-binding MarR family transcriptional regulator
VSVPDPHAIAAIRAWYRLDRAFASIDRWMKLTHKVSGEQVAIARILAEQPAWPVSTLRDRLSMHPATLGQSLARLEKRGFVQTDVDPADRRRRVVALTDAGRALVAAIPPVGPVRLRTVDADADDLDLLAAAFNRAVDLFGLQPWADDPRTIDTRKKQP